jgi:membrane protease YdiL (CAAX protease family)
MMNSHRKGIVAYLVIAFGLAWASWEAIYRLKGTEHVALTAVFVAIVAFAPAIACFVVRKWVTREGFADAGLRLHLRKWPYYVVSWLLPVPVMAFVVIVAPKLGLGIPDFTLQRGFKYLTSLGAIVPPAMQRASLGLLVCYWLVKAVVGAPVLFGEEFGWRGYLQKRLFPTNPVLSAAATGVIWGLWHLPATLRGYGFPDNPKFGALVMYPAFCIMASIIFGWLVLKTGSIWSSSLAHASTNAVGGGISIILFGGGANFLYVSIGGFLAMIPLAALSAWIVLTGQLRPVDATTGEPELARAARAS